VAVDVLLVVIEEVIVFVFKDVRLNAADCVVVLDEVVDSLRRGLEDEDLVGILVSVFIKVPNPDCVGKSDSVILAERYDDCVLPDVRVEDFELVADRVGIIAFISLCVGTRISERISNLCIHAILRLYII